MQSQDHNNLITDEHYRLVFEKAEDCMFLMKKDRFIACNPATLKMFGCTKEQIIKQTPYRFSPEFQVDGRKSDEKALEKIKAAIGGETQSFEWLHQQYDETLFFAEVTLKSIKIEGEDHLFATVRDISRRKSTEAELEYSRKQLFEQNENLKRINKLSNQLHRSDTFQEIADQTLEALRGIAGTTYLAIYLMSEDGSHLRRVSTEGFDRAALQVSLILDTDVGLTGISLKQNKITISSDFSKDERITVEVRKALLDSNILSGAAVPLSYQGKKLGCINLGYPEKRTLTKDELETLQIISNTVSQSLAGAIQIQNLDFMAHHDSLTGLSNRLFFHTTFKEKSLNKEYESAALMLLDLDRFKEINDTLGHHIGDRLLQQIGPRLSQAFEGKNILLCRLGGDEFTLLIDDVYEEKEILAYSEVLLNCLRVPFEIESMKLEIDASVGIAKYPEDGKDSHELLRSADVAMYEAKSRGGGIKVYDQNDDKHTPERLSLIAELNSGIRDQQLELHYQPKIDLTTNKVAGFEALVRWRHKELGLLYPDKFIALAEMSDSIHFLTQAVIELALAQQKKWVDAGYELPVAVNLSARNLIDGRCVSNIKKAMDKYQVKPGMLELEITETALMQDPETAIGLLKQISNLGVQLSIDDFGTGYSSLSYLRRMPINFLKIDREFVKEMLSSDHDSIIINSTIALAHNLRLGVIAEGVEDKETLLQLKRLGCDLVQGYYVCKPKPWYDIENWLNQRVI